ncbi:hypothetical protein [Thermococcus peptonophilus]|uniref:hypothetical protein n=1 Tax=Thermococcus peptonophilus TaxID=53952 RepID=UPI000A69EBD0
MTSNSLPASPGYAIAETFGTHYPYPPSLSKDKLSVVQELEKYRIKLYHPPEGTAVFNVEDWKFERIASEKRDFEKTAKKILLKHLGWQLFRELFPPATIIKAPALNFPYASESISNNTHIQPGRAPEKGHRQRIKPDFRRF